jgi:serine/threonine-protein phosphatase PP1 catalytic subunit
MFYYIIKSGAKMDFDYYFVEKSVNKQRLLDIAPTMLSIFDSEPAVLNIDEGPILVVGDIHGDLNALNIVLDQRDELNCKSILFLGDYVDRGEHSAEVLLILFELKAVDPNHIFLLRGNHEDAYVNIYHGFYDEIGRDTKFIISMHNIFQMMPIAAVLSNDTFCVHGGIVGTDSIDAITKVNPYHYLWNDPTYKLGITNSKRGKGLNNFGPDITEDFLATNGFTRIIRAHEYQELGYEWWFDGKLVSLFSSINYHGRKNKGAFGIYEDKSLALYIFDNE